MTEGMITIAYIAASVLFILALGGLSNQETALAMGIKAGAVKAHLVQARRKLLRRFGKEIEEWM